MGAQKLTIAEAAFVGRDHERAQLEAVVDHGMSGRGALVLIGGEPGIGKTSLVEQTATYAEGAGLPVLWTKCWDEEGAPAYRPWVQLIRGVLAVRGDEILDHLGPAGSDLAQIVPELAPRYRGFEAAPATEPGQARLRLFDTVADFFTIATADQAIVLALDDVHAADTPSVMLLRSLAHRLRTIPLVALASYRDTEIDAGHPLTGLLEESLPHRTSIALTGLGEVHVAALVGDVTGSPDNELAHALHSKTDGNPLFVKEFLHLLRSQDRLDGTVDLSRVEIPVAITEVIRRRLARLSEGCHRVLQTAAVIGQSFDVELLIAATGVPASEMPALVDEAIEARLLKIPRDLRSQEFIHPLVRETTYENAPAAVRARLHEQVGEAYEALYGSNLEPHLEELAYHFTRGSPGEASKAVDYSARAGRRALARLAYEEAAAHFEHALVALGKGERGSRLELLLELGDARLRAGGFEGAKGAYLEAAQIARDEGSPEALARAALGLGAGLSGFEITLRDQAQIDLLEEALDALSEEDSPLRAWLMARLSIASAYVATTEGRVELSRKAAAMAERVGDAAAHAYALSTFCDAESNPGRVRDRLEAATEMVRLARSVGDKEMELLGRRFRVVALMELGDRIALHEEIDAYQRLAEFLRQPLLLWYASLFRAAVALFEGRLDECERLAHEASSIAARAQSHNAYYLIDMSLLPELEIQRGDLARAHQMTEPVLEELKTHTGVDWPSLFAAWVTGSDDAVARAELERLASTGFAEISRDGMFLPLAHFLALMSGSAMEPASAGVLYGQLAPYAGQYAVCGIAGACYGNISLFLGILGTTLQRWDDAERHFEAAVEGHAAIGALPLLAHSRREYAAMLLRRAADGDQDNARELLRDAIAAYRDLGMEGWVGRAEQLLEPLPEPGSISGNVFQREGDYWTVAYGGEVARIKDSKGMRDLAVLLARPNQEIHVSELTGSGAGSVAQQLHSNGIGLVEGSDEVLDVVARDRYRARLEDLQQEIDEAEADNDSGRLGKLREEFEFVTAELTGAYGLGGRARKLGDQSERARKAVTGRIKDAISRIAKVNSPLGRHLERSVKTGRFCSYSPETATSWSS